VSKKEDDDDVFDTKLLTDIEEQSTLETIIKEYGIGWKKLAKHSLHMCYEKLGEGFVAKYFDALEKSESNKNRPFTIEEDQAIIDAINKYGRDWKKVKVFLP